MSTRAEAKCAPWEAPPDAAPSSHPWPCCCRRAAAWRAQPARAAAPARRASRGRGSEAAPAAAADIPACQQGRMAPAPACAAIARQLWHTAGCTGQGQLGPCRAGSSRCFRTTGSPSRLGGLAVQQGRRCQPRPGPQAAAPGAGKLAGGGVALHTQVRGQLPPCAAPCTACSGVHAQIASCPHVQTSALCHFLIAAASWPTRAINACLGGSLAYFAHVLAALHRTKPALGIPDLTAGLAQLPCTSGLCH